MGRPNRTGHDSEDLRLEGSDSTRKALFLYGPHARALHLATHADVEDEIVPSILDLHPEDECQPLLFSNRRTQVRGLSPMSTPASPRPAPVSRTRMSAAPSGWVLVGDGG